MDKGKLQVTVRSRKVLSRVDLVEDSFMTWDGQVRVNRRRIRVYEYVLDGDQARAVSEAREVARKTGMLLEVTDLARQNALVSKLRSGARLLSGRGPLPAASVESLATKGSERVTPQAFRP